MATFVKLVLCSKHGRQTDTTLWCRYTHEEMQHEAGQRSDRCYMITNGLNVIIHLSHFSMRFSRCDHYLFSTRDAGVDMLNDNCDQILGGAPASRADMLATDCI